MATCEEEQYRHYIVRVQTGDRFGAGTNSTISLRLTCSSGNSFAIDNLEDWGIMKPGHDYFEQGNLDIFFGKGRSLDDVCAITVTSNGQGSMPGWYLEKVEVIVIQSGSVTKVAFPVEQWLALDEWPYRLNATVNLCPEK